MNNNNNNALPAGIIPGFWRRILAYAIDTLLLAAICGVIGFLFYDKLVSLGSYGRLIGWFLALVYFTSMNSAFGEGQTIGKRIEKIKVVDRRGNLIDIGRSFIRSLVLTAPFFMNGLWVPTGDLRHPSLSLDIVGCLFSLVVFGGIFSIIYLYVLNRQTRQSLHDLIAGTFVVDAATQPAVIEARTPAVHKIVVGVFCALVVIAPLAFLGSKKADELLNSPLMNIYNSVQSMPEVFSAKVTEQTFYMHMASGEQQSNEMIVVSAMLKQKPESFEREAAHIAEQVLQQPDALGGKPLGISLTVGIDLGLAAWNRSYQDVHTAEEWKAEISKQGL